MHLDLENTTANNSKNTRSKTKARNISVVATKRTQLYSHQYFQIAPRPYRSNRK